MIGDGILVVKPHGIFRSEDTKNRCGDPETVSDAITIATDEDGDDCGKGDEAKLPRRGNPLFGIGLKFLHPIFLSLKLRVGLNGAIGSKQVVIQSAKVFFYSWSTIFHEKSSNISSLIL